jgi:hypothetical protein
MGAESKFEQTEEQNPWYPQTNWNDFVIGVSGKNQSPNQAGCAPRKPLAVAFFDDGMTTAEKGTRTS